MWNLTARNVLIELILLHSLQISLYSIFTPISIFTNNLIHIVFIHFKATINICKDNNLPLFYTE